MKNLDSLSKRFLVVCIGICAIVLSTSLFIFSINQANATKDAPAFTNPMQINTTGKYMMSYQAFIYNDGETGYNILVWDSETGKSRIYYFKSSEGKMVHWTGGDLPANPLD